LKPTFSIAVRTLVEFVLRGGDLRSDFWTSVQAIEGIRAHQRIQRKRPEGYEAEVPVQGEVEHEDFILSIGGRIDGVLRTDNCVRIEEIKTTRLSFDTLEANPNPIHWGQAFCYAYLLARQESLPRVDVQLTYAHPDPWRTRTFSREMPIEKLTVFFNDMVSQYLEWMAVSARWVRPSDW